MYIWQIPLLPLPLPCQHGLRMTPYVRRKKCPIFAHSNARMRRTIVLPSKPRGGAQKEITPPGRDAFSGSLTSWAAFAV